MSQRISLQYSIPLDNLKDEVERLLSSAYGMAHTLGENCNNSSTGAPLTLQTLHEIEEVRTQLRMLIYAIRLHPESPRSTSGASSPVLCEAAAEHSRRQASLGRQGHQRWESRFHRIWAQVGGRPPVEVCAESWPDELLLTACLGCVHAWRQSAGHWQVVAGNHPLFGYDIRRGKNRIWYATGIFGG